MKSIEKNRIELFWTRKSRIRFTCVVYWDNQGKFRRRS